jgi:hypothetical protein
LVAVLSKKEWYVSFNVHRSALAHHRRVAKVPKVKVKILIVSVGKKKKAIPIRFIPLSKVPKPKIVS